MLLLVATLGLSSGAARAEVLLAAHPLGLIDVVFPDGFKADLSPGVQGQWWASTQSFEGFMVTGIGADLFRDGQTILLPIRNTGGKTLECFGQLKPDDKDPRALHFLYSFSAPEATPVNSAYVGIRLPIAHWAGQPLTGIEGPQCAPALTKEPPQPGHLLNGQARGLIVAAGTPHELRVELDAPHWCMVNDERAWNKKHQFYTVQLCALVAADGTTLAAGQSVEIAGVLRFAEPVKVVEPQPIVPQVKDSSGWKAALRALGLGIEDAAGGAVLGISVVHETEDKEMRLEPPIQMRSAEDVPGAADVTGQVYGDAGRKTRFSVARRITVGPGEREMRVSQQLTAAGEIETRGVYSEIKLWRPLFDGCTAVFLNRGQPSVVLRDYAPSVRIARAIAPGLRIDAGGRSLLALTCKPETCWEIWEGKDAFYVTASFFDPLADFPRKVTDASTLHQDLTFRWGD
jgi:hypothetical protein